MTIGFAIRQSVRWAMLAGSSLFAVLACGPWAAATPIPVANFSFEGPSPAIVSGHYAQGAPSGWTPNGANTGNTGVVNSGYIMGWSIPDGSQAGYMNGSSEDGGGSESLSQEPVNFASQTIYTLQVDVAGYTSGSSGYTVSIEDHLNDVLATASGTASAAIFNNVTVHFSTVVLDPLAGTALQIVIGATSGIQTYFDNVRLDAVTVPEPTSCMLLGLGAIGLLHCAKPYELN